MKKLSALVLLSLTMLCVPAAAQLPDAIQQSLRPIEGGLIMPVGDQYLIDLDAASGLQNGDILSLVNPDREPPGSAIDEQPGSSDSVSGFLQVTQVKSGYSYAKLLSSAVQPGKGDRVIRFQQVPAYFDGPQEPELKQSLEQALPQLQWLTAADQAELIFASDDQQLTVTDRTGTVIRRFKQRQDSWAESSPATSSESPFNLSSKTEEGRSALNQTVDKVLKTVGLGGGDKRLENPGIIRSQGQNDDIWVSANLKGNPVGLAVADFDGDGRQETAVALHNRLIIGRLEDGRLNQLSAIEFPAGISPLSLDSLDTDGDGLPEIFVSAASGTSLSSRVIEFSDGSYRTILTGLSYFFRVIELADEGPVLVGQTIHSKDRPLSGDPVRLRMSGQQLQQDQRLTLPERATLFSYASFRSADGEKLSAYLSEQDQLYLTTSQGLSLWESSEALGGTETLFYTEKTSGNELVQPIYIQQRLLVLPSGDILAPQNEGPRLLKRYRNFEQSRILALRWDGLNLRESWGTMKQDGYLADFAWADIDNDSTPELITAVKYREENLLQNGRANLIIYEISE